MSQFVWLYLGSSGEKNWLHQHSDELNDDFSKYQLLLLLHESPCYIAKHSLCLLCAMDGYRRHEVTQVDVGRSLVLHQPWLQPNDTASFHVVAQIVTFGSRAFH